MLSPRIMKVLRDLTVDPGKNVMLVLAIAIGVFAVGTILGAYDVLTRTMAENYLGTKPAAATIHVARATPMTRELVSTVELLPGIARADRRATVVARARVGDAWVPILLFVIDDFQDLRTNTVRRLSGSWPPPSGTLLLERTALEVLHVREGSSLVLRTPHGEPSALRVSGVVHDPGLAPAWQEKEGYGYLTLQSLRSLGEDQSFDELRILLDDALATRAAIDARAQTVARALSERAIQVHEIDVPPPRFHPHQGQMNAVLSLFVVFALLALVLSSVLVASSISALMTRQTREIGVMKTLGASPWQISLFYLGLVLTLSLAAVLVAVPLSRVSTRVMVDAIAVLLNLEVSEAAVSLWVRLVQVTTGLAIPLLVASIPVLRGSRITIQAALSSHGVSQAENGLLERWLAKLSGLGTTYTLALRNVFRRRARALLAVTLLAAGGATFMAALDVAAMWRVRLADVTRYRRDDLELTLAEPLADFTATRARLEALPGVRTVEAWSVLPTAATRPGEAPIVRTYPDRGHAAFNLVAVPENTTLLARFPLLEGHWLRTGKSAENEVALNQFARAQLPDLRVGGRIALTTEGRSTSFLIVGFVQDIGTPGPAAYVDRNTFARAVGDAGANQLRIAYADRSAQPALSARIEDLLEQSDIRITGTRPILELRNAVGDHMRVLISSLLALAVLTGLIGALGLSSTMSINVMERTRELGVLRAIGATPSTIARLVIFEGLTVGVFSLLWASLLSLPLSSAIGSLIGRMAFRAPLSLAISTSGVVAWTLTILIGATLATLYPALRASRLTTREALAYD